MKRCAKVLAKKTRKFVFESRICLIFKQKKIALIMIGAIFGVMVLGQLVYPSDRALPLASVGGVVVGGKTNQEIREVVSGLADTTELEVYGHNRTLLKEKAGVLGVDIDERQAAELATQYPWWLRLVPTSFLWARPKVEEVIGSIDDSKTNEYIATRSAVLDAPPANAALRVDGEKVVIDPSKKGAYLSAEGFKSGLKRDVFKLNDITRLDVNFDSYNPAISEDDLKDLRQKIQTAVDKKINLEFGDKKVEVVNRTLGSWVVFHQAEAKRLEDIQVTLDVAKVHEYANEQFKEQAVKPAGVTEVYLTDGMEQRRIVGANGQEIDGVKTTELLTEQIFSSEDQVTIDIPVKPVPPRVKKNHTFTKSQTGLQAYVNSLAEEGDIRMTVRQLGGNGWSASYRGGEQTVSASTYKVYVVAYVLNQIKEGKASYEDNINGTTMRTCIERTIIQSDNACPEAMLKRFNARNIANYFHERGYSRSTGFGSTHATTTTNDLVKVMTDIQSGVLLSERELSLLMDLMSRTNHRAGVPAGSVASRVLNKVGFLEGYLNDAAIVYHPGGTYVISVMTKGASWAKIAEVTRKIEGLMY